MTLLSPADYRVMTGDMTNLDSDVDAALVTAQQQLEEYLGRGYADSTGWNGRLEFGTYTDIVRLHNDGRAYPLAIPITAVTSPVGAIVRDDYVMGLWPAQNPLWDILYEPYMYGPGGAGGDWDTTSPITTITYSGGYTSASCPRKLRQAIADLAKVEMTVFDPTLAGVTTASVGDVRVTYNEAPDRAGVVVAILNEVRGFKRREMSH
jgi:hypothetical protein